MVFLIEDENDEKFGYYLNSQVIDKYDKLTKTDDKSFEFNLQSNGRLQHPMKFEIKDTTSGYQLYTNDYKKHYLCVFGSIAIYKQPFENQSCYWMRDTEFNFHGIKSAIAGKLFDSDNVAYFIPKRFLVIQMK